MEETHSSLPPSPPTTAAANFKRRRQGTTTSPISRLKKNCLSFGVSFVEGFRYLKASILGLAKKMTARNEKEAAAADLQAEKMQVEAADAAENTKKRIHKTL